MSKRRIRNLGIGINHCVGNIASGSVGDGTPIMNDMARFLGALYRAGGVTSLEYTTAEDDTKTYSWNDALTMDGSRWQDSAARTLVSQLAYDFRHGVPNGTTVKFGSNMGDIVFKVVIQ